MASNFQAFIVWSVSSTYCDQACPSRILRATWGQGLQIIKFHPSRCVGCVKRINGTEFYQDFYHDVWKKLDRDGR